MKTREAQKVANTLQKGVIPPVHVLRKAAMQLQRPLVIKTYSGDLTYFPKGLKGEFVRAVNYRPFEEYILPKTTVDLDRFRSVRDLEITVGKHVFEPACGCEITHACVKAQELARRTGLRVPFDFNGISAVASPAGDVVSLYDSWHAEMNRQREAYLASDEHKKYQAERQAEIEEKQSKLLGLVMILPMIVKNREALIDWFYDFTDVSDDVAVDYDKARILTLVLDAGWVSCAWASSDPALHEENKAKIEADKQIRAEYIIGQCLHCLEKGMPPHPIVRRFIEEYRRV
jgi:hypothetical protein